MNQYFITNIKIISLLIFFLIFQQVSIAQKGVYHLKKVVIDAGHGGKDPGAVGKRVYEKNIVLPIALKLGKMIENEFPDVEVIYTRDADFFVELDKRAEIANSNMADLFISIHANSNPNAKRNGCETYIMGPSSEGLNFEVAKRENSVIVYEENYVHKYNGYNVENPETLIVLSLIQNAFQEQSLLLATKIQMQMASRTKRFDGGVHQEGFLVLWKTNMPSVLVETGYISNDSEEKYLMTKKGQYTYAVSIFSAFKEYKTLVEKRSRFSEELLKIQNSNITQTNTDAHINNKTKQNNSNSKSRKNTSINNTKHQINNHIYFSVQVYTSKKKLPGNAPQFKGIDGIFNYKHYDLYKYAAGKLATFDEASNLLKEIRNKIPDAFVIAFENNKRIDIHEAKRKTQK